jgi:hypothetical protein
MDSIETFYGNGELQQQQQKKKKKKRSIETFQYGSMSYLV